nr:ABC transporter substrate-binding protein [Paracoccus pantotrophus]
MAEDVDLLEPCMSTQSTIGAALLQNISETLTYLDVGGCGGLQPKLAESREQLPDGSWRFELRQGVTFSDGTPFDARDVKHSFDRVMSDQITCEAKRYFGGMTVSAGVVDDHAIDFKADPVQPILPLLSLDLIVPEGTPIEFTRAPVGTGPYVLRDWTPGQQIVLAEREGYWGDKPAVSETTYLFRTDPAVRAAMIAAGEADIAPSIAAPDATNPGRLLVSGQRGDLYQPGSLDAADQRPARAQGAEHGHRSRGVHRHPAARRHAAGDRAVPAAHPGLERGGAVPEICPRGRQTAAGGSRGRWRAGRYQDDAGGTPRQLPQPHRGDGGDPAAAARGGFNVDLQFYEIAEFQKLYSKPYPTDRGPMMATAMHDNSKGDPSFTLFFKYASGGLQSGISDPKADDLIARASAATGEERAELWSELQAYLHDDVVADVLLFHSVRFVRVAPCLEWRPNMSATSSLPLGGIAFK